MLRIDHVSVKEEVPQLYIHPAKLIREIDGQLMYIGKGLSQSDIVCIQSTVPAKPISAACSIYYYEVEVVNAGARAQIYVGLTDKTYEIGKPPGTIKRSFALRLDGKLYKESSQGETFCPGFSSGDIVGCGLDFEKDEIFFTRNGSLVGTTIKVPYKEYFATLAMNSPKEAIRINFGPKPFRYDLDDRAQRAAADQRVVISTQEVSPIQLQEIVHFYLMRMGYTATLDEFDLATGIDIEQKLLTSSKKRRKLSDLISPSVSNECAQCGGSCSASLCDNCILAMLRDAEVDMKPTLSEPKKGIRRAGSFDWGVLFLKSGDDTETSARSQPASSVDVLNHKIRGEVRAGIMKGEIGVVINILQHSFPALFSQRDSLSIPTLFVLRFVELVLENKQALALEFARSSLIRFRYHRIPSADGSSFQVRYVMGLLCYAEPENSPLNFLMTLEQRVITADLVNSALLELSHIETVTILEVLMKQLIASQTTLRELHMRSKEDSVSLAV
jgi:hypothetical protein